MATKMVEPKEKEKKKGGKKKLLLVALVIVLAGAVGGYFFLFSAKKTPNHKAPKLIVVGPNFNIPQLTTNLADGHIVQVSMTLELAAGDTTQEVIADEAKLEDTAILVFGSMTYSQLLPTSGRTAAEMTLASQFNQVLATGNPPHDSIVNVYFTSFIVQ
ncbi:MAG: flagellar basal body-associated FliL family protein [Ferrimicrobium sp.]